MGISWTKAQQEVIESQKGSLLVSAAAGSGKTAVLVERILQRICNPNDPLAMDNILVVTFTRAAAAQMKDKIRQAMEQKRGEEPDNAYLQLQAGLLDYAQIQTIDSFCLSVVRRYFHVLGLDPSFRMGEEGELKLMRADVLEELMEETYQLAEEDFEGFASIYGSDRSDEGILSFIETLYNFAQSHPYPERWIQDILKDYEGIEEEDWKDRLRERAWIKEVCQVWGLRDQLVLYDRALALCDCPYGPAYAKSFLQDEKQRFLEMIEAVEKAEEDLDYEGICRALQGMDFKTLPRKKKDDEVDEGLRDQMRDLGHW